MAKQDTASAFLAAVRGGGAEVNPTPPQAPKPRAKQTVTQAAKQVLKRATGKRHPKREVPIDADIVAYFEQGNKRASAAIQAVLRDHMKAQG